MIKYSYILSWTNLDKLGKNSGLIFEQKVRMVPTLSLQGYPYPYAKFLFNITILKMVTLRQAGKVEFDFYNWTQMMIKENELTKAFIMNWAVSSYYNV